MKSALIFLLTALPFYTINAQNRIKSGTIYQTGDTIEAPLVGMRSIIPNGWYGTLPQGEEVFLLLPVSNKLGYMFINVRQKTLDELKQDWNDPIHLTETITGSLKDEPTINDGKLVADFKFTGTKVPSVGYAEAIDGKHGYTFVFILLSPVDHFEEYIKDFRSLVNATQLEAPSITGIYDKFDWKKFLNGKYLMSYSSTAMYREKNEIWICPDSTFSTNIRSGGILKGEKSKYKGNKRGTWAAEGIGQDGTITLNYKKLGMLTLQLHIKDEQIFVNGERFFALNNENCR